MTHLEIICEAYDKCGIIYVVKKSERERYSEDTEWYKNHQYSYLLLTNEDEKESLLAMSSEDALNISKSFIEFENGSIASY